MGTRDKLAVEAAFEARGLAVQIAETLCMCAVMLLFLVSAILAALPAQVVLSHLGDHSVAVMFAGMPAMVSLYLLSSFAVRSLWEKLWIGKLIPAKDKWMTTRHVLCKYLLNMIDVSLRPFLEALKGSAALSWAFWALGADVEDSVYMDTVEISEPGMLTVRQGAVLMHDAYIWCHRLQAWTVSWDRVVIEEDAFVGPNSVVAMAGHIGICSVIGPGSFVMPNYEVPDGATATGSPAEEQPRHASGYLNGLHRPGSTVSAPPADDADGKSWRKSHTYIKFASTEENSNSQSSEGADENVSLTTPSQFRVWCRSPVCGPCCAL